jgi:hypothetical protein
VVLGAYMMEQSCFYIDRRSISGVVGVVYAIYAMFNHIIQIFHSNINFTSDRIFIATQEI